MGTYFVHRLGEKTYKYNNLLRKYWKAQERIKRDFKRMLVFRQMIGTAKYWCNKHQEKLLQERQKVTELTRELRDVKRNHHKDFEPYRKRITQLEAYLKRAKRHQSRSASTAKKYKGTICNVKRLNAKFVKDNKVLRDRVTELENVDRFFKTSLSWNNSNSAQKNAELMLRAIMMYDNLKAEKKITYEEIVYLCTGRLMETFNKEHIENRFGSKVATRFNRSVSVLMNVGFIAKLDRQNQYYITQAGKNRIEAILKAIYTAKPLSYFK